MERSEYCARELLHSVEASNADSYRLFLTGSERIKLAKTCSDIKFFFDWNFKFQDFYGVIASYHYPPLEFLWNINVLQIMPLDNYIINIFSDSEVISKFKENVLKLCLEDFQENDVQYFIQTGFLSYLVFKSFPVAGSINYDVKVKEVCLHTVKTLLQDIFLTGKKKIADNRLNCFFSLWSAGILEEESLKNFSLFAIDCFLNLTPSVNDFDAIEILESPNSSNSLCHLSDVFEKLFALQKPDKINQILTFASQKTETNIASLLIAMKACHKTCKEVSLTKLASDLMNEAFEKFDSKKLVRSLVIGWQIMHQINIPSHVSYRQWLQIIFKECRHLRYNHSISLLIQVLSDFVPYHKNIECLKAATDLNASIPHEAQDMFSDYIALVKTRIQDLKPQSKPEETVKKVLSLFESMGKIPPVVLEISLLQKQKFLNEFLPALLVPRVVPKVPDVKERFIQALDKAGKVPSNILQKYRSECRKEQEIMSDTHVISENIIEDFLDRG